MEVGDVGGDDEPPQPPVKNAKQKTHRVHFMGHLGLF